MKNVDYINLYDMSAIAMAGCASSQKFPGYPPKHDYNVRHIPIGGIKHFFQLTHTPTFKPKKANSLDICCFDSTTGYERSDIYPGYKSKRKKPVEHYITEDTDYDDLQEMIAFLRESGVYSTTTSVPDEANSIVFKYSAIFDLNILYDFLPKAGLTCLRFHGKECDDIIANICNTYRDVPIHIWGDDEDYGQMHLFHPKVVIHSCNGGGNKDGIRFRQPKNYIDYIIYGQNKDNIPNISKELGGLIPTLREKVLGGLVTINDLLGESSALELLGFNEVQRNKIRINTLLMYPSNVPVQQFIQDKPTIIDREYLECFLNTFSQNQEIRYLKLGNKKFSNCEDIYLDLLNKRHPIVAGYYDTLDTRQK